MIVLPNICSKRTVEHKNTGKERIKVRRIGIITCGKEPNYGACLQALATQYKISELGYDAELMNYSFMDEKSYSPFHQKHLRPFVSSTLFYALRKSLHVAFRVFREKHMRYTNERLSRPEDFKRVCDNYDAFLVGSDQVWNPELGIDTDITLLKFYDKGPIRLSYASSFGVSSLPKELEESYRDALNRFEYISTREASGKELVYKLTGKDSVVSLDPTMLLTASEWEQYEEDVAVRERYVLIYDMRHSPMVMETAKKLAESKKCKVLALSRIRIGDKKIRTLYGISPGQFLTLIKNAEAVVTDSFHGTIFSITYEKEFYSYCSRQGMKIGSRITNILSSLCLEERLIHDGFEPSFSEIEYSSIRSRLESMREVSLGYLKKILAGDKVTSDDCVTRLFASKKKKQLRHVGEKKGDECCGCSACAEVCPSGAIALKPNDEGFLYPSVDESKCICCKKCLDTCGFDKDYCDKTEHGPLAAYIARSSEETILNNSASGGMFTVLTDQALDRGASVYGAVYNEDGNVSHDCAQSPETRDRMRGSKYVQSDMGHIYDSVLLDLKCQKEVFFSGTPCQNAGLISYLSQNKADFSKLFLCDIICHGVCSPAVFKDYLSFVKQSIGKIATINTRDKKYGSGYNMTICGEKGVYHKNGSDDPYIRLFQLNLPLRSSCFSCPFKRVERVSDITIGDFQKASKYFPEYADKKGVSVVLVNTSKGERIFESVKTRLDYKESTMEAAMQPNLHTQIESSYARDKFFKEYKEESFVSLLKRYTTLGLKNRMIYKAKQIAKTIIRKR